MKDGVLVRQHIEQLIVEEAIVVDPSSDFVNMGNDQLQPNSIDLRVSDVGHRVRCSLTPSQQPIGDRLYRYSTHVVNLADQTQDGYLLERNTVYLFKIVERLKLPKDVRARFNPKSSTGRLDIFCRVIGEAGFTFDEVPNGYEGALYLEIVSRSFPIIIRRGERLVQMRLIRGEATLSDASLAKMIDDELVVYSPGKIEVASSENTRIQNGVYFSVGLTPNTVVGYRARKNTRAVDLQRTGHSAKEFWTPIFYDADDPLLIEPDEFYILRSAEVITIPSNVCAEMVPFDAGSGEFRAHYAGFFDSGFGYSSKANGFEGMAAIVLELRGRDVPFCIEPDSHMFRMQFMKNTAIPDVLYGERNNNYQSQQLKLSKHFRNDL